EYCPEPACPMLNISWYRAALYCRWLSEQEGVPEEEQCFPSLKEIENSMTAGTPLQLPANYLQRAGYRLLTDMEWEYACRAGSTSPRFYGHDPDLLDRFAWLINNADERSWPVGRLKPND